MGQQRWWETEIPVNATPNKGELMTHNLTELIKPESYEVRLTPITRFGEGDSAIRIITYSRKCWAAPLPCTEATPPSVIWEFPVWPVGTSGMLGLILSICARMNQRKQNSLNPSRWCWKSSRESRNRHTPTLWATLLHIKSLDLSTDLSRKASRILDCRRGRLSVLSLLRL